MVEDMIEEDEEGSMGHGLVSPLGSCPCGCASGSVPGLPTGVGVHVAHSMSELHHHARGHGA